MSGMLSNPITAVILGVLLGVCFLVISLVSFRLITPERPEAGLGLAALLLLARLGLAVGALFMYKRVAPLGLTPFAISLACGFLIAYGVELVKYAGLGKYLRARSRLA